jgi:hypothetical protein
MLEVHVIRTRGFRNRAAGEGFEVRIRLHTRPNHREGE